MAATLRPIAAAVVIPKKEIHITEHLEVQPEVEMAMRHERRISFL
jgi:hypothetical protein